MTTTPQPQAPPPGVTVGGYELLTRLGEGGMGVVHLARRPGERRVALKVIRPHVVGDDEARRRLAREVGSLGRVRSPRVAEIVDADPWGPVPYVATRYVPGLVLHDHVHEEGPLAGPDLVWFAHCLGEALTAVHAVGVLHRDIKPSNVIMEGRSPVLIDFGLARVADDPKLTHTGWLLGTPGYLAPEILYGEDATTASDVHAWAATVAFAGIGDPPYGRGPTLAIMDRVRRGEHRVDGLPRPLRDLVVAALDPDPARRPPLSFLVGELAPPVSVTVPRATTPPDPVTVPLAVAALAGTGTDTAPVSVEPVSVEPVSVEPVDAGPGHAGPAAAAGATRGLHPVPDLTSGPPGWPVRLRRGVLALALGLVATGALAAFPFLATVAVALTVWVLRSGTLAVDAARDRRRIRGLKWYDGPQLLLATPWHLLQSTVGTALLGLWAGGLGVAGGLLGYAAGLASTGTLALAAAGLVAGLWWGPGGSRVRRPVAAGTAPVADRPAVWLVGTLLVLALAAGFGALAATQGPDWAPAQEGPFGLLSR